MDVVALMVELPSDCNKTLMAFGKLLIDNFFENFPKH
jgi:hypothetical protein